MRRSAFLLCILPLLLLSCKGGKGRLHLQGKFQNLDQADFLVFSPDGGTQDVDTLHLVKGQFEKDIPLKGGPYTFTIVYPNYSTLSFLASEGDVVTIKGDALALDSVSVEGTDSIIPSDAPDRGIGLKVGDKFPQNNVTGRYTQAGKYLLIGFWANWKGGTSIVNYDLRRAREDHGDKVATLSYSLDVDPQMKEIGESSNGDAESCYCDYLCWDSPLVRKIGLNNVPYFILVSPQGKVAAMGYNYGRDIDPRIQ